MDKPKHTDSRQSVAPEPVAQHVQSVAASQPSSHVAAAGAAAAAAPAAPPVAWEIKLSPEDATAQDKKHATPGRPKRSFFSPPHRRGGRQQQPPAAVPGGAAAPRPDTGDAQVGGVSVPSTAVQQAALHPTHGQTSAPTAAATPSTPSPGRGSGRGSLIPAPRKSPGSLSSSPPLTSKGASPVDATAQALRAALSPSSQPSRRPPPSPFESAPRVASNTADTRPSTHQAQPVSGTSDSAAAAGSPAGGALPTASPTQEVQPAPAAAAPAPAAAAGGLFATSGFESDSSGDEQHTSFSSTPRRAEHQFVASPSNQTKAGSGAGNAAGSPTALASPARSVAMDDVLLPWHCEQQESLQWSEAAALTAALPVRCSAFDGTGRYCAIGTNSKALLIARLPEELFDAADPAVEAADNAHWGEAADTVHRVAIPAVATQAPLSVVREYAPFHAGSVYSIAWGNNSGNDCSALAGATAPSSSLLATCSNDTAIHVLKWQGEGHEDVCGDTSGPEPVAVIRGHSGTLRSVAFLNAGTLASGGGRDFNVRLWDVATMRTGAVQETQAATETELQCLQGHSGTVFGVCRYSSVGAKQPLLLSCSDDGSVRLWDCRAGNSAKIALHVASASGSPIAVHGVAVDHMCGVGAGHAVPVAAACADGHVRLLDIRGTQAGGIVDSAACHTGSDCRTVAFAPGGDLLVSGGFDGSVAVSSSSLGVLSAKYRMARAHTDKVLSVAWHPWAPILATTGADAVAKIWAGHA